jgi:hypothetical protein
MGVIDLKESGNKFTTCAVTKCSSRFSVSEVHLIGPSISVCCVYPVGVGNLHGATMGREVIVGTRCCAKSDLGSH